MTRHDNDTNLYDETVTALERHNLTPITDVRWVGSADGRFAMPWTQFATIATNTDYYSGYGGAEIVRDLVVVGDNWWLSRGEYDGSEWWDFNTIPHTNSTQGTSLFNNVTVNPYHTTDMADNNVYQPLSHLPTPADTTTTEGDWHW